MADLVRTIEIVFDGSDKVSGTIGGVVSSVGRLTAAFGAAALTGGAAVFASQTAAIKELALQADTLGTTTESLSAFQYAAQRVGVDADKSFDILSDLTEKIGEFINEDSGEAKAAFEVIGLSIQDFVGLKPEQAFEKIATAVQGLGRQEQIAIFEMLASDAKLLLPLVDDNLEKLKELKKEAEGAGAVVTADDVEKTKLFNAEWSKIAAAVNSAAREVTVTLAPAVTSVAALVGDVAAEFNRMLNQDEIRDSELVKAFEKLGQTGVEDRIRLIAGRIAELSEIEAPEGLFAKLTSGEYDDAKRNIASLNSELILLSQAQDTLNRSDAEAVTLNEKQQAFADKTDDAEALVQAKKAEAAATKALVDRKKEEEQARKAAQAVLFKELELSAQLTVELEKLASNERIKELELQFNFDIEQLKTDAEKAVAIIENLGTSATSTGDVISSALGAIGVLGADVHWSNDSFQLIERQLDIENKLRQKTFELQEQQTAAQIKQTESQTKYLNERTRALSKGDSVIKVEAAGLTPALELIFDEVLRLSHIKASSEGADFLLGL
ncbi:MAG: hypothetical protein ACPGF7_09545 [Pontibacterium sp.]